MVSHPGKMLHSYSGRLLCAEVATASRTSSRMAFWPHGQEVWLGVVSCMSAKRGHSLLEDCFQLALLDALIEELRDSLGPLRL